MKNENHEDWRVDDFVDEESFFAAKTGREDRAQAAVFLGTSGWSYKDWEGSFYAAGTRPEGYLKSYASAFRSVEIDSTFYSVPRESVVRAWAERSPDGFVFAAKFPRDISHEPKGLSADNPLLRTFLERMALLEDKLGPLLLQFPRSFRPAAPDGGEPLRSFLTGLSREFRYAVEFRHQSWYRRELLEILAKHNIAWTLGVGPDNPTERPVTADFAYIRWLGDRSIEVFNRVVVDRRGELDDWTRWIEAHRRRLHEIYGYFNNHYSGHAPATARELLSNLGEAPPPPPASLQGDLFT